MAEITPRDLYPTAGRARPAPSRSWAARGVLLLGSAVIAVVLVPLGYLAVRAGSGPGSALDWILRTRTFLTLARTLGLAAAVTGCSILIAVPLAWLTTRTDLPGRRLWAVLTALPLVIPSYVAAYLLTSALGPRGLFQGWLEQLFGVQRLPDIYGFPGALLVLTLLSYPYILLSVRAALARLDPQMEEAARGLGLSAFAAFRRVTLPQLRPAIAAGALLVALYALRDFGAVSIMRYNTFTRVIFIQYQSAFDRSTAAALAIVLVVLTAAMLAVEGWFRRERRTYSREGSARPPRRVQLGRWKAPALAFTGTVVALALVLPGGVLGYWLARGVQAGEQVSSPWPAAWNSILVSALAAAVILPAALPVAIAEARISSRISRLLERLAYLTYALPGVVVALALVFLGANYLGPLYQTLTLLVFAYLILFLPQAVGALRTSLLQIHPHLEEAARGLGKGPWETFTRITLPILRPGVAAGAGLVFLTAMKELPATLILAPFGFKTLATSVWSAVSEAFFAQAAAPALLLILASSLPMALLTLRERT